VKALVLAILGVAVAAPAWAQRPPVVQRRPVAPPPTVTIRPFVMATEQSFAAIDTFDAVFDKSYFPFFGGGAQILIKDRYFVEFTVSRFRQTGERAFLSGGRPFKLGIPLTATITPVEIVGGYRFKVRNLPRVRPYIAAGIGSYGYQETSSFAEAGEDVDIRHSGYLVNGGAEFRVHRWAALAIDAQYSHVAGIIGNAGVSQQAGESDLGGIAARVKLVIGR
jgi:hypothetical protein